MKKPSHKKAKAPPLEPKKTPLLPLEQEKSHKKRFEQLLDDAIEVVKNK